MDAPEKKETKKRFEFIHNRRFKYGSIATGFTVVFIAIVILANVILQVVVSKFPLSWDITNKLEFKLSSDTVKYLKTIKTPIYITVLASQSTMKSSSITNICYENLQQYAQYNSDIHVRYLDITNNPSFAKAFSGESLATGDIIVAKGAWAGTKYKLVSLDDCFPTSYDSSYNAYNNENDTESVIDGALLYVNAKSVKEIVFTSGHNEGSSSSLQSALKSNNYSIKTQNLTTASIDSKATTLAIVSPTADLTSNEVTKINAWLDNNGKLGRSLAVFFDPSEAKLPNLEALCEAWGIKVGSGYVYDESGYSSSVFLTTATSIDSDLYGTITTSDLSTAVAYTRPLTTLFSSKDNRTVTTLMKTSNTSKLTTSKSSTFKAKSSDKSGPFTAMTLTTKTSYDTSGNARSSYVLVSGSTLSWTNSTLLNASQLNNQKDIVATFNKITGSAAGMNIASKDISSETITISSAQSLAFTIIFVIAIPLLILLAGLLMFLRRRHL